MEEKHVLYEEPWPDENFTVCLYNYLLKHDADNMNLWPSCKKSHEINLFLEADKTKRIFNIGKQP